MQEIKTYFKTTPYGKEDDFILVRTENRVQVEGLPPTYSQCIMMNKSEIESLIQCLLKMK
jgi:hypothetical protein